MSLDEFRDLSHLGLGTAGRPYLIAEAGSNHDGDVDVALALVDVAADAGCDAVKFQLFTAESLYPPNVGVVDTPAGPADFNALLRSLVFDVDWIDALQVQCDRRELDLLFTPFDEEAVEVCRAARVAAVKMASPEITHLPLLRACATVGVPVLVSTGMSTLGEIEEALAALGDAPAALLQCTTAYPCPEGDANVATITSLRAAFGLPVGLSDHTLDPLLAPAVATARGAALIEKHITLGRHRSGPDHPFAIEPDELASMVALVREVAGSGQAEALVRDRFGNERVDGVLGSPRKRVAPSEAVLAVVDRRSIRAQRDLAAGSVVTGEDVAILRGERNLRPGLHPRELGVVVGARLQRDVAAGDGIVWADLVEGVSS